MNQPSNIGRYRGWYCQYERYCRYWY